MTHWYKLSEKNREKHYLRTQFNAYLRAQHLQRGPCATCGSLPTRAYHLYPDELSRDSVRQEVAKHGLTWQHQGTPHAAIWLCTPHHRARVLLRRWEHYKASLRTSSSPSPTTKTL